jgi:hypothetical protein
VERALLAVHYPRHLQDLGIGKPPNTPLFRKYERSDVEVSLVLNLYNTVSRDQSSQNRTTTNHIEEFTSPKAYGKGVFCSDTTAIEGDVVKDRLFSVVRVVRQVQPPILTCIAASNISCSMGKHIIEFAIHNGTVRMSPSSMVTRNLVSSHFPARGSPNTLTLSPTPAFGSTSQEWVEHRSNEAWNLLSTLDKPKNS